MVFLVLAAFFLGFGIAFTSEAADHSLKDRGDAEDYLGLPVLGSVPDSKEGLKNGDLLR
jgi:capsular polysaccharide biosynthesis protein